MVVTITRLLDICITSSSCCGSDCDGNEHVAGKSAEDREDDDDDYDCDQLDDDQDGYKGFWC